MYKAIARVIIDGQAWLYANQLRLQAKMGNQETSEETFKVWQDEWKAESSQQIIDLTKGDSDSDKASNPS